MWKDTETAEDLLGYRFHAKLLKDIVLDERCFLLPLAFLVIGDMAKVA